MILKRKISLITLYAMYMKQLFVSFKQPHRLLALFAMVLHTLLANIIVGCIVKSEMVSESPAEYYSSLDDVVNNFIPGHSPFLMKGLEVESKLIHSNNALFQRLGKVSRSFELSDFAEMADQLSGKSVMVEDLNNLERIRAVMCTMNLHPESIDLLRQSAVFYDAAIYIVFNPNISVEQAKRVIGASYALEESGLKKYFDRKEINIELFATSDTERSNYFRCSLRSEAIKWPSGGFEPFSFTHFKRLMIIFPFVYCFFVIVLCCEVILSIVRRTRTHVHPVEHF